MARKSQAGIDKKHYCNMSCQQPRHLTIPNFERGLPTYQSEWPAIVAVDYGAVCSEQDDLEDEYYHAEDGLEDVEAEFGVRHLIGIDI